MTLASRYAEGTTDSEKGATMPLYLSAIVVLVALSDLVLGWTLGFDLFIRVKENYPALVPGTAFGLLVGAFGLIAIRQKRPPWIGVTAGCILLLLSIFPSKGMWVWETSNLDDKLSIATRINFFLLAIIMVIAAIPRAYKRLEYKGLACIGAIFASITLVGYLFDTEHLFSTSIFTSMSLLTASSIFLLYLGALFLEPGRGWTGYLFMENSGGEFIRRGLVPVLTIPLAVCLLMQSAVKADLVSTDFRLALLALMLLISAFSVLVLLGAWVAFRARSERELGRKLEMKERALREAQALAAHAQRVNSLGRVAGGIAHDFNNLLAIYQGNIELLTEAETERERLAAINEAHMAIQRGKELTAQLLAFGRRAPLAPTEVNLSEALKNIDVMLSRLLPASVNLRMELDAHVPHARIDAIQFEQAILNLVVNARDAMPKGGDIVIRCRTGHADALTDFAAADGARIAESDYVIVTVEDSGIGIPKHLREKILEPFFTTKAKGEGTGLGLSMVYGFVEQSQGYFEIRNALEGGAQINLWFPRSRASLKASEPARPAAERAADGPEKPTAIEPGLIVLLVEDNSSLRAVLRRLLELKGCIVHTAEDGAEGLSRIEDGLIPDLLLTDLNMPGEIQGTDLIIAARRRIKKLPCILVSGFGDPHILDSADMPEDVPVLSKPITGAALIKSIKLVLKAEECIAA